MKISCFVICLLFPIVAQADPSSLAGEMKSLDEALFDSFNKCADAGELVRHASYFASDVEFYHDSGGVTWDRQTMIENTKKFACGNYTRELVPGTFEVFPIKDFGVITKGVHIFCQTATMQCDGKADFVMVWHQAKGQWEVTRVLSYGHRSNS
jgi:hypothetical protein